MANKLLIVMVNTDPANPTELGAPLFQATAAATMEYDVEVVFSGRAGELAREGVAAAIPLPDDSGRSVYDVIRDAADAGVKFKVCPHVQVHWPGPLIAEIVETVGGAYVISEAMDDDTVTFTY